MKMKNAVPELIQNDNAIIASFGNARLMKMPSGHCELVGGTIEDRALAGEWISLFMHELVACTRTPAATLVHPRNLSRRAHLVSKE